MLNTSGPNTRGSTGPMTLMGLGATFDRALGNAWGQTEGTESRAFMVTGMFGPQTDLDRLPNWGRNLTTTGEDPYLSHELVAAQINGMQGVGAMSQMKHFVVYNGQNQNANTDIGDQGAARALPDAVRGRVRRRPRRGDDVLVPDLARHLDASCRSTVSSLSTTSTLSPFAKPGENPQTWPLNESHFSCEQPLILNYVLRDLWGSQAFVGSDYPATHSTSGILQGEDQEMPTATGFFAGGNGTNDPTGRTCAYYTGNAGRHTPGLWDPAARAIEPHRRPAERLPGRQRRRRLRSAHERDGCRRLHAERGVVERRPAARRSFNQSLARILYQEQRFGLLGCDPTPAAACTNPGGIGGRPHRHRAAAARRRLRRQARHEERRRRDRREVLRGGRDAAQERRQRAAADGGRPRRRHPRHRRRARTTRSPTRRTRRRPASSTATRSTRCSS